MAFELACPVKFYSTGSPTLFLRVEELSAHSIDLARLLSLLLTHYTLPLCDFAQLLWDRSRATITINTIRW